MRERLLKQVWRATAPLLLWAAHFAALYGLVAVQCSPAVARAEPAMGLLWTVSALALAACGWLLWRARGALAPSASLVVLAQAGSALLALAGIAWTSAPLLLLGGCG